MQADNRYSYALPGTPEPSVGCSPVSSRLLPVMAAVGMLCAAIVPAQAGTTKIGNIEVNYGLTANYGVSQRLRAPDPMLIHGGINPQTRMPVAANADDGNRNFRKNALVSNRLSLLGEADFRYQRTGLFLRASAFHDWAYQGVNDNNSPATINKIGRHNRFSGGTRKVMGNRARLLDAYLYTGFDLGKESSMSVKVGTHAVQWGEGLFFPNIAGAQGPVDANKANLPGIQVKDILLPVGQVSTEIAINNNWSVMAYAQYEYEPIELPASGSFFSYADLIGDGADRLLPGMQRTPNRYARNSGQWGIGTRYRVTFDTELGLYYLKYHSKAPVVSVTNFINIPGVPVPVPTRYHLNYQKGEDIKLTGFSISSRLGPISVAGELSHKKDVPVWTLFRGAPANDTRGNVWQAQINGIYTMAPNRLVKGSTAIVAELATQRVSSYDSAGGRPLAYSRSASAFQVAVTPSWPNVFTGWDLSVPINYAQMIDGKPSGDALGSLTGKGDKRFSIGAEFTYLNNLQLGISLNHFLGSPDLTHRPLTDRDYIAFNLKYNF